MPTVMDDDKDVKLHDTWNKHGQAVRVCPTTRGTNSLLTHSIYFAQFE
jgi:hypothetical protein